MSDLNVKGRIIHILDAETGTSKAGKEWKKQSMVIDTGAEYNPNICISFFGDKTDLLKKCGVGQSVEVGINISSRDFNGKYYHNIDGWKIINTGNLTEKAVETPVEEKDDLPF